MKALFKVFFFILISAYGRSAEICKEIADVDNNFLDKFRYMETQLLSDCEQNILPLFKNMDAAKPTDTNIESSEDQIKFKEEIRTILTDQQKILERNNNEVTDSLRRLEQSLENYSKVTANKMERFNDRFNSVLNLIKSKDDQIVKLQSEKSELEKQISAQKTHLIYKETDKVTYPSSCLNESNGLHMIEVKGIKNAFQVFCKDGWTVIQRRVNGKLSFTKSWQTYVNGFGNLEDEFFIGLEKLHWMTNSQNHELLINVDNGPISKTARYSKFQIDNEINRFKLIDLGVNSGNLNLFPYVYEPFKIFYRYPFGGWWGENYSGRHHPNGQYNNEGIYFSNNYWKLTVIKIKPTTNKN